MPSKPKAIPVPHVRISSMETLKRIVHKDKPAPRQAKRKVVQLKRCYRLYKERHKLLVVKLRYGSLTDFSDVKHKWVQIEKLTGIAADTARIIVYRFHANNNSAQAKKRLGRPP